MGERTSYEPGTFSWVELSTTDPEAAKSFYGDLFGWDAVDREIPDGGGVYSMQQVGGRSAAAITGQPEQQRAAGVPPNWFSYVTVASTDESAERAKELGGAVHAGPFDVMDAGRMAVVADPAGAMFGLWEAGDSIGAEIVNDPGCLTSNELNTTDFSAAREFYSGLFGWDFEEMDTGDRPPYWAIHHDGAANRLNGGARELTPDEEQAGAKPYWVPYFTASSAEAAIEATQAGGGKRFMGPMDIPAGRIAVLQDPQGASFNVFEGEVDD